MAHTHTRTHTCCMAWGLEVILAPKHLACCPAVAPLPLTTAEGTMCTLAQDATNHAAVVPSALLEVTPSTLSLPSTMTQGGAVDLFILEFHICGSNQLWIKINTYVDSTCTAHAQTFSLSLSPKQHTITAIYVVFTVFK